MPREIILANTTVSDISRKKKLLEKQKEGKEAHAYGRKRRDSAEGIYECAQA